MNFKINGKLLLSLLAGIYGSSVSAAPTYLPTGPFIDTTLHDGSRNGAVGTLSADGRYAVYDTDNVYSKSDGTTVAVRDVVVFDKTLGTVTQITYGDQDSYGATISSDGRYVAFVSQSMNFALRNPSVKVSDVGMLTNLGPHIYMADLRTDLGKISAPTTFEMVDTTTLDASGCRAAHPLTTMCIGGDGAASSPFISADGTHVAFVSSALNLDGDLPGGAAAMNRVYLWDRASQTNRDITPFADGYANTPTLNSDATRLAFVSTASNIVTPVGTTFGGNVFLWDGSTGAFRLVSANGTTLGNGPSWSPALSADGAWVAYTTLSDNLDANDTNGEADVYVYSVASGKSYGVSVTRLLGACKDGADELSGGWKPICLDAAFPPTGGSEPSISADGRYIAFMSASPLINQTDDKAGCDQIDKNDRLDVYVADMANGGEVTLQSMLHDSSGKLWATPNGESRFPTISANGQVLSFETSNAGFFLKDFEKITDPLRGGDGSPKVLLLDGLQRRSCP